MQTLDIRASNIKCGGCAANIKTNLMTMDGISQVEVTIDGGLVHIEGEQLDTDSIKQKLAEIGYPAQ